MIIDLIKIENIKNWFRTISIGPKDRDGFATYHFKNSRELDPR